MDISRVETKGKQKGKSKSKGKSKMDVSSHKGKGKVKGKFSDIGKGKGKPSTQVDKSNVCLYCGKAGHWKRDCRKYKHDQATGQVRQVEGGISQQVPPPPLSHSSLELSNHCSLMFHLCSHRHIPRLFNSPSRTLAMSEGLNLPQTGQMKQLQWSQTTLGWTT